MAVQKYYNGTTWVEVNGLAPNIIGSADPTTSTIGYVGQLYTNSTTNVMFLCTAVSGSTYTWTSVGGDMSSKEDVANKVTSVSSSSTNTQYPSAKAVYDELLTKEDKGYITINGTKYEIEITNTDPGQGTAGKIIIVTG